MNFLQLFSKEVQDRMPVPERLALSIAGMAYPDLDITIYEAQLDALASECQQSLFSIQSGYTKAEQFLYIFNGQLGFQGNQENYYDPTNSFLNDVLEQRTGLPIMLSLLCMAIGRRLGLDIQGMGFPGHFMVRYQDEAGAWLLDPFHGCVVVPEDASQYLTNLFHQPVQLPRNAYIPVTPTELAQRILVNLRNVYLGSDNYEMSIQVLDYLEVLMPSNPDLYQERGLLHYECANLEQACLDLRRYYFLNGHLIMALEVGEDFEGEDTMSEEDWHLLSIYQEIEELRSRIN